MYVLAYDRLCIRYRPSSSTYIEQSLKSITDQEALEEAKQKLKNIQTREKEEWGKDIVIHNPRLREIREVDNLTE